MGAWDDPDIEQEWESKRRFTLIDGKIDNHMKPPQSILHQSAPQEHVFARQSDL